TFEPAELKYIYRIHNPEGFATNATTTNGPIYSYYRKDHLGNNREVWRASYTWGSTTHAAATVQKTQYYPSGLPWKSNSGDNPGSQPYKFNGCEFIEMHGYDVTDLGNRGIHHATNRFTTMDRFCEKFPWQSPYVHAGNNPVNYVDVNGDSIMLTGNNLNEIIMAIYKGLGEDSNVSMRFNNGVLDPESIKELANSTKDVFIKDLYEIASHEKMVELSVSGSYTYKDNDGNFKDSNQDYQDYQTSPPPFGPLINDFYDGKWEVVGNTGRVLVPGIRNPTGANSTNGNLQIIINAQGTLNQRVVGLAHEFGHIVLYLRTNGQVFRHGQNDVNNQINIRIDQITNKLFK
ncbi:MAG: hypothetical protein VB046_00805, partial [Paludibacter sp.]|nr:hypothetical protein [Paludibacter sp.]